MPLLDQSNLAGALQAFRQRQQGGNGAPQFPGMGQRFPRQNPNPGPLPPGFGGQRFPRTTQPAGGGYDGSGINPGAGAPRVPGGFSPGTAPGPAMPQPQAPTMPRPPQTGGAAPMVPGGGPAPLGGRQPLPSPSQNPGPLPPGMGSPVPPQRNSAPQFRRPELSGAAAVPSDSNPILIHQQQPKWSMI